MSLPPVYTEQILAAILTPGGTAVAAGPGAGFRWVVVDITAGMVNDGGGAVLGLIIGTINGNPWRWQCPNFGRRAIHWHGRQVINDGDVLTAQCDGVSGDPGEVDLAITAYKLSLP